MCNMSILTFLFGAIFTLQGMRPDPAKVQALQDLPAPENSQKLQLFLGLINYLQPFLLVLHQKLPSLDSKSQIGTGIPPLTKLFTASSPGFTTCFSGPLWPTTFAPSPLSYRLMPMNMASAPALIQNNKPIAFASKTLTDVETRYTSKEKECLCFWP